MKAFYLNPLLWLLACLTITFTGCKKEDPGTFQEAERSFELTGFDRVEMGSAFLIRVQQGTRFSIVAKGDSRNLDDLDVRVINGNLIAEYRNQRNRQYSTSFDITLPTLQGVNFSGASKAVIKGFDGTNDFVITLSGASKTEVALQTERRLVRGNLSGASDLLITGRATQVLANLSGASTWRGGGLVSTDVEVEASGASTAQVSASASLRVSATGASRITYRGNPQLSLSLTGGSTVQAE
jgi:hypothetical protein